MTVSFYDILGIDDTASQEEIKKAYRSLSMKHHPDKGGNPEEFSLIAKAYETLSDPEARERYDRTGEGKESESNILGESIQVATQLFMTAIDFERPPSDIMERVERVYSQSKKKMESERDKASAALNGMKSFQKRIERSPENDFIGTVLDSKVQAKEAELESMEKAIRLNDLGIELLREYGFSILENDETTMNRYGINIPSGFFGPDTY